MTTTSISPARLADGLLSDLGRREDRSRGFGRRVARSRATSR